MTSFQLLCLKGDKSYIYVNQDLTSVGSGNDTVIMSWKIVVNFLGSHFYHVLQKLFLFSPFACPITIEEISKPSTGGVLLILFLIGTFTYFTIGSIVRFMYLGARGIEVIPNLDFWKDLPGLVRVWFKSQIVNHILTNRIFRRTESDSCRTVVVSSAGNRIPIRTMPSRSNIIESKS